MRRTWTNTGREIVPEDRREQVARYIAALEWHTIPPNGKLTLPFCQGEGIKTCISELRLPRVLAVAHSPALAPYGLLGVRCRYTDGQAQVYVVDRGSDMVPIASDFWPEERGDSP